MHPIQRKILQALVAAGGELTLGQVEELYERRGRGGDSAQIAGMNRRGLTEYIRPEFDEGSRMNLSATGLRITQVGREAVGRGVVL